MDLGKKIAARRKALKLSQEYLADQLGISRQAVSKWETGQSEPSAQNLAELAALLEITVSELVEPEQNIPPQDAPQSPGLAHALRVFAIIAYTGGAVLYTIKTNDPFFPLFAIAVTMIPAIFMAINILKLPAEARMRTALKELGYCAVICCLVLFVEPLIGNVFTSVIIMICCVVYIKYIRFPHIYHSGAA